MKTKRLLGVHHVGINNEHTVCSHCDKLSATRECLTENDVEWIVAPCKAHAKVKQKPVNLELPWWTKPLPTEPKEVFQYPLF